MADTDQLLEILQADVAAVLAATPALALANVLADNEGDIEARVARALSTLTETGGKQGLAVVVLLPEITEGEANLPGPPLTVKVEVRVLENVLLNRAAAKGTLLRSSQAALNVLASLHLRHLGHSLLVAGKDPVSPVDVKKGHVSHAVTLTAKFNGFVTPRPSGVEAVMAVRSSINITGTSGVNGIVPADGNPIDGRDTYNSLNGAVTQVFWFELTEKWIVVSTGYRAEKSSLALSPVGLTGWTIITGSGQPTVTAGAATSVLSLSCASPSSVIRSTTDGSYPVPTATLYTGPLAVPTVGTVVRAAAYVSGQPPSDVLEFTIVESI